MDNVIAFSYLPLYIDSSDVTNSPTGPPNVCIVKTDSNRYPVNSGLYMSSKTQAFVNKLLFPPYNRK